MVFKNQNDLEKFLKYKSRAVIAGVEQKVHSAIDKCLRQFYAQFEPDEYIRTEQLLHSLVKSEVKPDGKNGYVAEVYFDINGLNYPKGETSLKNGGKGWADWDIETILDVVMTGSYSGLPHGGWYEGTAIWTKSMATIGDVWKLLEREFQIQGIPIKKNK